MENPVAGSTAIPEAVARAVLDPNRLTQLRELDILDSPREEAYDAIAQLARKLCNAAVSLVCLVDEERQWFKAQDGLTALMGDISQTPVDTSFCAHAIQSDEILLVADAQADPRFKDKALVREYPHVRAYAGAPLVLAPGIRLGTVCVLDTDARDFTATEVLALQVLRDATVAHLKLRMHEQNRFLVVCAWCKDVLDLVTQDRQSVKFTHGICDSCARTQIDESR